MKTLVCVLCAVALAGAVTTVGDAPDYKKLYEEQKARTDALEKRLAILEEKVAGEYVPKSDVTETTLGFLGKTEISGYVAGSYFFNFNEPSSHENTGRGFDVRHNEFMLNKAVLKLEKPTEFNAFDWTVGYGVELLFGQDAEFTQASGLGLGDQGDLLQAYVEFNVPVGNGLKVLLGKCSTEMGFELTETEQNYNWSAGNQWTFLEPFTHTGIRLTYALSDQWEAALLFNNGWDNVRDNNNSQSWMGRLRYSPNDNTSYTFIGFGGPEQGANNHDWRRGVDIVIDHKWNHIWHSALQLDYGAEDGADASGGVAEWWGVGLWMVYEPSEKWNVAFRGDWVNDIDGARTSETPYLAPFPPNDGQELISLTLTVNFKPVEELRIAPELRWDHSTLDEAFGGHSDQVTIGVGAAYFF